MRSVLIRKAIALTASPSQPDVQHRAIDCPHVSTRKLVEGGMAYRVCTECGTILGLY